MIKEGHGERIGGVGVKGDHKGVMNLLITQQNYNQQIGYQDALKAQIAKTAVVSMSKK